MARSTHLSPAPRIEQDLEVRDLTINAMARRVDVPDSPIVAHPLALHDLRYRLLRPVRHENFAQDPCRGIRAARFAACLPGFAPGPGLFTAMRVAGSQGLGRIAGERVAQELRKACAGAAPARFLAFLARAGILSPWFAPFAGKPALRQRTCLLMQRVAGGDPLAVWMAMCHALAPELALDMGQRLCLPRRWIRAGVDATVLLPDLYNYQALPADGKVGLLMHLHLQKLSHQLCSLVNALYNMDMTGIVRQDTDRILAVKLPLEKRGKGKASGTALFRLRVKALDKKE